MPGAFKRNIFRILLFLISGSSSCEDAVDAFHHYYLSKSFLSPAVSDLLVQKLLFGHKRKTQSHRQTHATRSTDCSGWTTKVARQSRADMLAVSNHDEISYSSPAVSNSCTSRDAQPYAAAAAAACKQYDWPFAPPPPFSVHLPLG